jgi:glycerophosphoryl diester phosphodiesterase
MFPGQAPCDGARIPTLTEVLALTVSAGVRVEAELKTSDEPAVAPVEAAEAVLAAATAAGALPLLGVRSFDWRGLAHLRRHHQAIPLTWLTRDGGELTRWPAAIAAEARGCRNPVWAPAYRGVTEALVAKAHALGLGVAPWTVNAPADMARLIGWGVDGLCTDRPDLARAVMAGAGLAPPRAVSGLCSEA